MAGAGTALKKIFSGPIRESKRIIGRSDGVRSVYNRIRTSYFKTVGTALKKVAGGEISDLEFLRLNGLRSAAELRAFFETGASLRSFLSTQAKERWIKQLEEAFPEASSRSFDAADKILNHRFDLLGSGEKALGEQIDWHLDFKVNRRWPLVHPRGLDLYELNRNSDVKVPWELSRFQHLISLGEAYWLSRNEKYAEEFRSQIKSWIKENPHGLGINWASPMDAALRACQWILAWHFFKDSPGQDERFAGLFLKALYQHGTFVAGHLENRGAISNNHYLSNLVGLLYLGMFFQHTASGKKWRQFALSELASEMLNQTHPDGMDFEGSTCYHILALELFFYAAVMAVVNGPSFQGHYADSAAGIFGKEYVGRLAKMFDFVRSVSKPNGQMPQIGDNDNGRLHSFSERPILDVRYLLNMGAVFFENPKYKIKEFGPTEDVLWIFGIQGYKKWKELKETSWFDIKSQAFENSGIFIMRHRRVYLISSVMPNGQKGFGGHNHNDVLSFELNVDGADVIIDPGTYSYTGDYRMRNWLRSTCSHNTATIDSQEINRFREKELFRLEDDATPRLIIWESQERSEVLTAEHSGYSRLPDPVIHKRTFCFDKESSSLQIDDHFSGRGNHQYEIFFHFPPAHLTLEKNSLRARFPSGLNMSIEPRAENEFRGELREGWYSPSYGAKIKARYLCYSGRGPFPLSFRTVITFSNSNSPIGQILLK